MNQSQRKKQENPRLQRNDEQVEPLGLLYTGEDGLLSHWWFWLTFSPVIIVAMLRLGGVASSTYLVAFPAIKKHFQQHGLELDWVLYSSWDALVEAFVRREVDVAWNGPLAYIKIKRRLDDPCQVVAMRDIDVNLVTAFITQRSCTSTLRINITGSLVDRHRSKKI